jgi:hypothetical protein
MPEKIENEPKLQQKTLEAIRLVQNGADEKTALQIVNNKAVISERAIYKLKDKCKRYSLTAPAVQKLADSQLKRILKGKAREEAHKKVNLSGDVVEYIDNVYPSDTNIIAAITMVKDRTEPAIRQNVNINVDVHPVDLSNFSNRVIDVTPVDNSQD